MLTISIFFAVLVTTSLSISLLQKRKAIKVKVLIVENKLLTKNLGDR
jgi:hypothetical protein